MATATRSEAVLQRFGDVQVYVHAALATSILVLWLTGLPLTFNEVLGWLVVLFGHGTIVIVHVAAGVLLILTGLFYLVYAVLGLLSGTTSLRGMASLPRLRDAREGIDHVKYLIGLAGEPDYGKYTVLQKAEIWIIAFETVVMSVTGLGLWYLGVLNTQSPNLTMLIVRDVHAIVAVTMLMGVVFHLFMTHVKEFPMDQSIFDGTVGVGRACQEWAGWAEREVGTSDVPCEETTHSTILTTGMVVTMLLFGIIWTGVILQYVLAPLPTGPSLLSNVAPNALPGGLLGGIYLVGLNLAAIVIVLSIVAIGYGLLRRWRIST